MLTSDNPQKITLYRGVSYNHPDYINALMGIATPWDLDGHNNPELHNGGNYKSIFTSWSLSRGIADYHANKGVPGGVVLIKSFHYYQVTTSPDNYNELEVLVYLEQE